MPQGFIIGLSGSSLIFFILFLFFSIFNYKKRFAMNYDIRNHFPYELNYKSSFKENLIGNLCLIMSMVLSISAFACSSSYFNKASIILIPVIAGALYSLLIIFIPFSDIKYIRFHVLLAVLLAGLSFLTPSSIGLVSLFIYQQTENVLGIVYLIIGLVIGLFSFALIMNPKFSFDIKMKVVKLENGQEETKRPTIIVIAFSEWLLMFSLFLSHILLILLLYII